MRIAGVAALCTMGSLAAGCSGGRLDVTAMSDMDRGDMSFVFPTFDLAEPDLWMPPTPCTHDYFPCSRVDFGGSASPLVLERDGGSHPFEQDQGLRRDGDGWLTLDGAEEGTYSLITGGCQRSGAPVGARWLGVIWEANTPSGTRVTVQAKSGGSLDWAHPSWQVNPFTAPTSESPLDLHDTLCPNDSPECPPGTGDYEFLQVRFRLVGAGGASPRLRSFAVGYRCPTDA